MLLVMDVFISWSGDRAGTVAKAMRTWLEIVFANRIKPWCSSEDIIVGTGWFGEISKELGKARAGIVIVTPENMTGSRRAGEDCRPVGRLPLPR